jgi:signal transduction histidine kinase
LGWRLRTDGSLFWASVVVTPLRDEEGELYGFSKVTRDMTDRRALLEEIEQHSRDLDQSNAELESFAYSVSHDLRAPLRAISGFADALQQECSEQLDNRGIEYLNEIANATQRMNALVQDLLEYGRVGRVGISLVSTSLLSAIDAAKEQLGDIRGSLTVDVRVGLCVYANPEVLTQVILNLLANAFNFCKADSLPEIHVTSQVENGVVRLSVRDNGIGIAAEHQERIWNVFERLHGRESYGGTGIGLAIVKRAMTRMNGSSGVVSQLGEGSTFWIELPHAPGQNSR